MDEKPYKGMRRVWPPRFSLRGLLLFVAVTAVASGGFDIWRRTHDAENARAECERQMERWQIGVGQTADVIDAVKNAFESERRQWLSSAYEHAIVDSYVLRLTRIRDSLQGVAESGIPVSEEAHASAWKQINELTDLIRELEEQQSLSVGTNAD